MAIKLNKDFFWDLYATSLSASAESGDDGWEKAFRDLAHAADVLHAFSCRSEVPQPTEGAFPDEPTD